MQASQMSIFLIEHRASRFFYYCFSLRYVSNLVCCYDYPWYLKYQYVLNQGSEQISPCTVYDSNT